jgi:hypothetical protein
MIPIPRSRFIDGSAFICFAAALLAVLPLSTGSKSGVKEKKSDVGAEFSTNRRFVSSNSKFRNAL